MGRLAHYVPLLGWARAYNRSMLLADTVAAGVVTIMLIPQSLAYATLAGLPAQMGLYASIAPLIVYAIFGTSRTMAVGPVAIISLMTAAAAGGVAAQGTATYAHAAILLALLSGAMMTAMGLLRLGAAAKLMSHPVVSAFTMASSLVIAVSQIGPLLGVPTSGQTLYAVGRSLIAGYGQINIWTVGVGVFAIGFLAWVRKGLRPLLLRLGMTSGAATLTARAGPVLVIIATTVAAQALDLAQRGVRTVGFIPTGLPSITLPPTTASLSLSLIVPAFFISVIGFASSISVAQALAAKRREQVNPSQELLGLGLSNVAAAFTGGFPVTGGFARSIVNFDAGAQTPAAGAFAAVGIAISALVLTPALHFLPVSTLAAIIVVAVVTLIDVGEIRRIWRYSKRDFAAMALTMAMTLAVDVQTGLGAGVVLSILLYLHRASQPHVAIVGLIPGSQHFRNVDRYSTITAPDVLSLRIDESLSFANAELLDAIVMDKVDDRDATRHVVLMCSAINDIDTSALIGLERLNDRLLLRGVQLHLSEVKGPVMDRLAGAAFLSALSGQVFLSQYEAFLRLAPKSCADARWRADLIGGAGI